MLDTGDQIGIKKEELVSFAKGGQRVSKIALKKSCQNILVHVVLSKWVICIDG